MIQFLSYLVKFLEQRNGLTFGRQCLLLFKVVEFSLRRLFSANFVMTDIWGIRHRYSSRDVMGFKTVVGVYELEEQIFFQRALSSTSAAAIVDVGSAVGTFTSLFAKYAPTARVYSFEPNPFSNRYQGEQLKLNGLDPRVTIFPAGLGSAEATAKFSYVDGIEGSLWGRFDEAVATGSVKEAEIRILKLDDVKEVNSLERLDFIKLDIEGFELPALHGMEQVIVKYKPVVFCEMALSFLIVYEGNRYRETFDFFEKVGYEPYLLKHGRLVPYTWPEFRVMNLILLPRQGGGDAVRRVREEFVA